MKEENFEASKEKMENKKQKQIDMLVAKPETWSEKEREVYGDKTLIDMLMCSRMVLIKELDYKNETESGIIMVPGDDAKPLIIGMVASFAPDCRFLTNGDGSAMKGVDIKAGDIVSYAVYNGTEFYIYGQKFFMVRDMDIFAKVPDVAVGQMLAKSDRTDHLWTIRKEMTFDADNPNDIGPKSSLHVDNYAKKQHNKRDKAAYGKIGQK